MRKGEYNRALHGVCFHDASSIAAYRIFAGGSRRYELVLSPFKERIFCGIFDEFIEACD
jgi:hypothetical protein